MILKLIIALILNDNCMFKNNVCNELGKGPLNE